MGKEHGPALEHRGKNGGAEIKDMHIGAEQAEQKCRQRDDQPLPELQLQDIGRIPADGLQDAYFALFFAADAGGLVPGEDAEGDKRL